VVEILEFFPAISTDLHVGARNGYRDVIDNSTLRSEQSTNGH